MHHLIKGAVLASFSYAGMYCDVQFHIMRCILVHFYISYVTINPRCTSICVFATQALLIYMQPVRWIHVSVRRCLSAILPTSSVLPY